MVEVEKFEIHLLNDTGDVYFEGEKIRGIVKFKLNRALKIRQISLNVDGRVETSWTSKKKGIFSRKKKKFHTGSESIVSTNVPLWPNHCSPTTSSLTSDSDFMPPGHYAFPFTYALPCRCFSSYEGSHGSIRYLFTAIIDRPWRPDLQCKLPFTVVELVDLNDEPSVAKPTNDHCIHRSLPVSCLSTNVECQIQTERNGFVPGEKISCSLWLSGNFGERTIQVKIRMLEISRFVADTGIDRRKEKFIVHRRTITKSCEDILSNAKTDDAEKQHFVKKCLPVPALAPMINSGTIQVSYQLEVKVTCNDKKLLKRSYPILIGTIPLLDMRSRTDGRFNSSTVNGHSSDVIPKSSNYTALMFAENFFGSSGPLYDENDENVTGPQFYTPRYPLYHVDCTEKSEISNGGH